MFYLLSFVFRLLSFVVVVVVVFFGVGGGESFSPSLNPGGGKGKRLAYRYLGTYLRHLRYLRYLSIYLPIYLSISLVKNNTKVI